jgi:predicted HTH domain antitoxin
MAISLHIPDDLLGALKLPPRSAEQDLRKELAVHLVAEGLLPEASACRLAGMSRLMFARLPGDRHVPARYTTADVEHDLQTLSAE